jgi:hypothetical protein
MRFRTEIQPGKFPFQLNHRQAIISLGSCFSENMAFKLKHYQFEVSDNPFGTSYNPMSLANQLERLLNPVVFSESDLNFHNDLWFSFEHYTMFSNPNKTACLKDINTALNQAAELLPKTGLLILTLGTAHAWQHKTTGNVVNNCHKIPADQFNRVLLKPYQIINRFLPILNNLETLFPEVKVLFTVSPVRHWRDGAEGNQRSKSILHVAAHELTEQCQNAFYFPAYELLMDDLRDYRFYTSDLLHPTESAINYIWEKFALSLFSEADLKAFEAMDKLYKMLEHRSRWPESEQQKKLIDEGLKKVTVNQQLWPLINWDLFKSEFERLQK